MNKSSRIPRPDFNPDTEETHREFYGYEDFEKILGLSEKGALFNKIARQGAAKDSIIGNKSTKFFCFNRNWKVKDVVWLLRYKEWPKHKLFHLDGAIFNNSQGNLVEEDPTAFDRIKFDKRLNYWQVRIYPKSRQNRFKPKYFFSSLKEAVDFRNKYAIDFDPTQTT